jgi:hypothetical protein
MATFTSAEIKLRTLALQNAALQNALGGSTPSNFRWFNRQLEQNDIARGLSCVRLLRVSTVQNSNMGGIMNLSLIRFQIDAMDFDSETARQLAQNIKDFMGTVNLCSGGQFNSPLVSPNQNPCFLSNQVAGMIPNPQSRSGPIYYERLEFLVYNREDIAIQ